MRSKVSTTSSLNFVCAAAFTAVLMISTAIPALAQQGQNLPVPTKINPDGISSGARAWWLGPNIPPQEQQLRLLQSLTFGSNVDANDPNKDLAAGQAETAIAASGNRVMAAWNDATGFLVQPSTERRASLTGVGFSSDGAQSFTDLIGLPNNDPDQQWFGDPTVVAVDGGKFFIVGSLYLPSNLGRTCFEGDGDVRFRLAISVATVSATNHVTFSNPIIAAGGGNLCSLFTSHPNPNLAMLDKEFLSYDSKSRTLAMSYTRFFLLSPHSGNGQIEINRAHVPLAVDQLKKEDFGSPIVIWPEEQNVENEGAYVKVGRGGNTFVTWERNWFTNLFNGNPFVYIHAARVRPGEDFPIVGGPLDPRVITLGQENSNGLGGVKSLDAVVIAGYNRGIGNDFPRLDYDYLRDRVIFAWNDASRHPLGDIWLRDLPPDLDLFSSTTGPIRKVNNDNSFSLHFLPAVSVRGDGSIATSWYDRRLFGPDSTKTDYFGEIRASSSVQAADFRITTGATDWLGTSSLIIPNFGDYTDIDSTGTKTYFIWSDGRIGVPQPFVDSR